MTRMQIIDRFTQHAPKAARGRRRTPGLLRRRTLPIPQPVGGRDEAWAIGYLIDTVLTRDPWMHRADLLVFLRDWLTSSEDSDLLAASLDRFPGSAGTDTSPALQFALSRFTSLLTPTASEMDF